ncbi:MAG: acyltransferase family protein [Cryomorphaceae bacterium]|nr:acyltransferase family protein [Cryomorphaceae bacterium]
MVRNFGLDLVRTVSIWLVLMQHAHINIPGLAPLRIGIVGVEFFFVLSGLLIGSLLFKTFSSHEFKGPILKEFWARRWLRTLPLYYTVLLFRFFFIENNVGANIGWYVVFLQNNFYGVSFFDVSWSLVIEEWFYLLAPLPLLLLYFLKNKSAVPVGISVFIFFILAARMLMVVLRDTPYEGLNSQFLLRFDALFLGVLLAWIKHYAVSMWDMLTNSRTALLGAITFIGYIFYYWTISSNAGAINESFIPRTIGFTLLPFTIALMLPWFSTVTTSNSVVLLVVTQTSILTYGLYLIHPMCFDLVFHYTENMPKAFVLLLASGLAYIFAFLAYRLIELPMLSLRDRYFPATYRRVF